MLKGTAIDSMLDDLLRSSIWVKLVFALNLCLLVNVLYQLFVIEQSITYLFILITLIGLGSFFLGIVASLVITLNLVFVFYAISWAKIRFIGLPFYYQDLQLVGWNVAEVIYHDWRAQAALVALVAASFIQFHVVRWTAFAAQRKTLKGTVFIVAALALSPLARGELRDRTGWRPGATGDIHRFMPTVTAFALSWSVRGNISLQVAPRLAGVDAILQEQKGKPTPVAGGHRKINVVFIQYESTFAVDRVLPERATSYTSQIITPDNGKHGSLYTPIYGGGSWLSEFSLVTGQSPFSFGPHAFTLQFKLANRLRSSLGIRAQNAGFVASIVYPVGGHFLNAQNFYEGLGFDFYAARNPARPNWIWVLDDDILFQQTAKAIHGNDRNLVFMVTMTNHAPHNHLDPFGDYYKRLQKQDRKLAKFKAQLNRNYADYENYIVSYGDHQPSFTSTLLNKKLDLHKTFWSIDCVGLCDRFKDMRWPKETMGLEFLPGFVTEQLGVIPADDIVTAQKYIWGRGCRSLQFECSQKARNTFNWIYSRFIDLPDLRLIDASAKTSENSNKP